MLYCIMLNILKDLLASVVLELCPILSLVLQRTISPPGEKKEDKSRSYSRCSHSSATLTALKLQPHLERSVEILNLLPQHGEVFTEGRKGMDQDNVLPLTRDLTVSCESVQTA